MTLKTAVLILLLPFAAYSGWAMLQVGYLGIWQAGLAGAGELQILFDLVIACLLIMAWMIRDARDHGRNPWPYIALTLGAGSFGPLLYLLLAPRRGQAAAPAAA